MYVYEHVRFLRGWLCRWTTGLVWVGQRHLKSAHGGVSSYILDFPDETFESIMRDIDVIQRELPIDLLEFFMSRATSASAPTPWPGNAITPSSTRR